MKVKSVPIEDIEIGERFRDDYGNLEELAESIKEFGLIQPISITQDYVLLAGGRRLQAAILAGLTSIPCVIHKTTEEVDNRELELQENIARKDFTWTERANLERKIFDLRKEKNPNWTQRDQVEEFGGAKGSVSRRLQLAEIISAVPELADSATEDEAWKKYQKLQELIITEEMDKDGEVQYGDAIKHADGHYKIGDAIEGLRKVGGEVVSFIEVDPPYGVDLHGRKDRNKQTGQMDNYNEVSKEDYQEFVRTVAVQCYRVLRENSFMVWWYGPEWYAPIIEILRNVGFKVSDIPAVWTKTGAGQTASPDTMLGSSYEPFFVCRKGQPKLRKPGRSNVFSFDPVPPQHKIHPTERPIELMDEIMDTFCYPSGVVCVPFLGSGVSLRAAYRNNCTGYGWDLDDMTKKHFLRKVYLDKQIEGEENE